MKVSTKIPTPRIQLPQQMREVDQHLRDQMPHTFLTLPLPVHRKQL